MPKTMATVVLFKPSGKYYTTEEWRVPAGAVWPYVMEFSPDFHRIADGAVLVPEQEPWNVPHLFGSLVPTVRTVDPESLRPTITDVAKRAYENGVRDERALTEVLGPAPIEAKPVTHAGADGACPDYGSRLDPCPPGCASGVCVAGRTPAAQPAETGTYGPPASDPEPQHPAPCGFPGILPCICPTEIPEPAQPSLADGQVPTWHQKEVQAPIWVPRTWTDVRDGDTVRMPGTDATAEILSALAEPWHVDPKTGTSSWNPPQPLEFTVIHVLMQTDDPISGPGPLTKRTFDANPAAPVEILIDQLTLDAIELLGGWPARIRTEQTLGSSRGQQAP